MNRLYLVLFFLFFMIFVGTLKSSYSSEFPIFNDDYKFDCSPIKGCSGLFSPKEDTKIGIFKTGKDSLTARLQAIVQAKSRLKFNL